VYIYIYIYREREGERERGGGKIRGGMEEQREKGNAYMILVAKSQGRRPLVRPRHEREDKIKVDFK
jgi:hypothetical protein